MNSSAQNTIPFPSSNVITDRLVKLRDAKNELRPFFDEVSFPKDNTFIAWIEEGILLGEKLGVQGQYYVFRSSLDAFKRRLAPDEALAA